MLLPLPPLPPLPPACRVACLLRFLLTSLMFCLFLRSLASRRRLMAVVLRASAGSEAAAIAAAAVTPELIDVAHSLADAAAEVTARYFRTPVPVDVKSDASPVTIADREAEAAVRALLAARCPDHAIFGEEQGYLAGGDSSEWLWVIDPIDGTKSFITGRRGGRGGGVGRAGPGALLCPAALHRCPACSPGRQSPTARASAPPALRPSPVARLPAALRRPTPPRRQAAVWHPHSAAAPGHPRAGNHRPAHPEGGPCRGRLRFLKRVPWLPLAARRAPTLMHGLELAAWHGGASCVHAGRHQRPLQHLSAARPAVLPGCNANAPVLARLPAPQERWLGVEGRQSTLNGAPIGTRACGNIGDAYLYATTPHMFAGETEAAFNRVRDAGEPPLPPLAPSQRLRPLHAAAGLHAGALLHTRDAGQATALAAAPCAA